MFGILLLAVMFLGLGLLALGVITVMSSDIKTNKSFIIAGLALFLIGCIGGSIVTTVDAGHVGIEKTFGAVSDNVYNPGLIIKSPWVEVVSFNVQQHESMQCVSGGSRDEPEYSAEVAFIYQVDRKYAPWIYEEIGLDYENVAITSQMLDACREVLGKYDAMYAYAEGKDIVKASLFERVQPEFAKRHLILLDVNLREYDPPQAVKDAAAEMGAVEKKYQTALNELRIKEVDAQKMQVEANAIAEYQKTVSEGISPELIMWRGQEKLAEAAASGNMIIVVTDGKANIPMNMLVDGKAMTS
jgi:regulator of protease activity HflC (stomatin/prohibitin superfamily)